MGMPAIHHRRWTTTEVRPLLEESHRWPRYELIDGELIVTPSPGVAHQVAVVEVVFIVKTYFKEHGVGIPLSSPADLELVPDSITQPDVFVLDPDSVADDVEFPTWADFKRLLLAVEIISPSSVRIDRIMKRDFYLDAGVPEYWIVDLDARIIERWTQGRESPEVCRDSLEWLPENEWVPLTIDVPKLFETIRAKSRRPKER